VFGVLLAVKNQAPAKGDQPDAAAQVAPAATADGSTQQAGSSPADAGAQQASTPPDAAVQHSSAAPDAATKPGPKLATLTFTVKPPDAEITVDGKPVKGGKAQLPVGDQKVKVVVSAPGYVAYNDVVTVARDQTVTVTLKKEVAEVKPPQTPNKPPGHKAGHKPDKPKVDL
jgi:hypothetical protein